MDGKRRLPLISDTPLLSPESQGVRISVNCFSHHSENQTARSYHRRGLAELHRGYWTDDEQKKDSCFNNAFGLFYLALKFDSNYFCAREALSHVAGLLDLDHIEGAEKYANGLRTQPLLSEPMHGVEDSGYDCHLIHNGFYSASDIDKMLDPQND